MMDPVVTQTTSETVITDGFSLPANNTLEMVSWHPGIFLILLGIFWIFVGLSGKGITSHCIHYGETVKKIRV